MPTEAFTISPSCLTGPHSSTTLITGGSSGIGLATAHLLFSLSPSNNIIILDLQPPPPISPLHNSSHVFFYKCNITDWVSQRTGFAAGAKRFGGIDNVFVNAGISEYKDQFFADDLDVDGELKEPDRRTIEVDTNAANDTVKLAIWHLRNRTDRKKGGSIVLTASLAGYLASAGAPLYSAAKHGIVGLMRALKNDLAKLHISISLVAPGITTTPILLGSVSSESPEDTAKRFRSLGVPINQPEEIATAVAWLMSLGMEANGKGLLIQAGTAADVEAGLAKTRKMWMGTEILELFKGGRSAPLFPNKL